MVVRSYLKGPLTNAYPRLLIDTGSTYTVISHEILESVGCLTAFVSRKKCIVTAS